MKLPCGILFFHNEAVLWRKSYLWNFILTNGIWRKCRWFKSMDIACQVLAVKVWTSGIKEWSLSEHINILSSSSIWWIKDFIFCAIMNNKISLFSLWYWFCQVSLLPSFPCYLYIMNLILLCLLFCNLQQTKHVEHIDFYTQYI